MIVTARRFCLNPALRERARSYALGLGRQALTNIPPYDGRGLGGHAGDALFFVALVHATGEDAYVAAMHERLKQAANLAFDTSIGLFGGMSGLRAVAALAAHIEPRYQRLVEQCDAFVDAELPREPSQPPVYWVFDMMEGWAGVRLARGVDGAVPEDHLSSLLAWILEDQARWTCPHPVTDPGLPVSDVGVAHGIAGVLAAAVLTHDPIPDVLRGRIERTAALLAESKLANMPFATWPHSLGRPDRDDFAAAWCYGTPGVAAVLHAVARALGDTRLAAFSLEAMLDVAFRTPDEWRVYEDTLCHGLLGNALCFASVAWACDSARLWEAVEAAVVRALDRLEREGCDIPNELRGRSGVGLALLTLCGDAPATWMRLHGLEAP